MTKVEGAFSLVGMAYFVYILASQRNGTLYVGVTNDLVRRIYEHREKLIEGFTSQYNVTRLVWFDQTASIEEAIAHEKRLKRWQREWKIALIEKTNPNWDDLYEGIL
jgi:putative endonuclease